MSFDDRLNAIFDRFINHQATEADKQTLRQLIRAGDGKNAIQLGKNIVNIAEGRDIQIGDRTYYGTDAEAIKEALRSILQENQTQKPINCPKYIPYSGVRQFVGREKELTNLHQQLQQPRTVAISAVAGMGGVGKTELAIKYALEHQANYPGGICWLNAITENLEAEIVQFASLNMNLKVPQKLNEKPLSQGRYSEAESLYIQALNICSQVLGENHPNTQVIAQNYNICCAEMKKRNSWWGRLLGFIFRF